MNSRNRSRQPQFVLALAVVSGVAIAAVDNFAFGGETSPIVTVALLLVATLFIGAFTARRRWIAALAVWIWLPGAHLVRHVFGLPDTIQPNTYSSILLLGAFTLAVTVVGTGCGILVRRMTIHASGGRGGMAA